MKLQHVHLWCPNMFEFTGGIQAYSKFLTAAILKVKPNVSLKVFLKHDKSEGISSFPNSNISFSYSGKYPAKIRTFAFSLKLFFGALFSMPDLVISTHLNFSPVQLILKKLFGLPYWVIAHGVDAWGLTNKLIILSLKEADLVLAVSNYTRDRLIKELGLAPEKVKILPNTFNENCFTVKPKAEYLMERHALNRNDKIMLTVCRFDKAEKYKGYDQVLKCMATLKYDFPNFKYIMAGTGSDLPRVKQMITELEIDNSVMAIGPVSGQELPDYYSLCDLFVMPSKGEGFGIVFLEALASGKPCIAGNSDGAADPLQNGRLGELIDADDLEALTESIKSILLETNQNQLLFKPEELRNEIIKIYGFDSFCNNLSALFHTV